MKENIEIPAAGLEPRGEITIELFDEKTGELMQQEKQTNYVQQRLLSGHTAVQARRPFTYLHGVPMAVTDVARTVVLTDYAGAADPANENFMYGSVIGYGDRNEPASGTMRGAYNANESSFSSSYSKLVFDFATSQGNGTFQSIYTKPIGVGGIPNPTAVKLGDWAVPFPIINGGYCDGIQIVGTKIYFFFFAEAKAYIVDKIEISLGSIISNFAYEEIALPAGIYQGAIRGGDIYFRQTSGAVIKKAPLATPSAVTDVKTLPETPSKIGYHEMTDRFFTLASSQLRFYDNNFNLIEAKPSNYTNFHDARSRTIQVTKDGKLASIFSGVIDLSTGVGMDTHGAYNSTSADRLYNYTQISPDFALGYSAPGNTFQLFTAPTFFSRVLLDSPVTKTAQQNMKITYEFNIPKLKIFGS